MCTGAFIGFASFIFSGSMNKLGELIIIFTNKISVMRRKIVSLNVKLEWNSILSIASFVPSGFLDPVLCSKII